VIQHLNIQEATCLDQLFGQGLISGRGFGVSGWVVVCQDDRAGIGQESCGEDHFGICHRSGNATQGDQSVSDDLVGTVKAENVECFTVREVGSPDITQDVAGIQAGGNLVALGVGNYSVVHAKLAHKSFE